MPRLTYCDAEERAPEARVERSAIPFPRIRLATSTPAAGDFTTSDLFEAFCSVNRRMEDLARELGCLGFFDDDDDRPRAA